MSIDRPFGPVLGRRGLSLQEMQHALLEIGFDPSIHPNPTPERLVDLCHLYADSGIPPILVVETDAGWHAVTVVGYTLKSPASTAPDEMDLIPAHHFISELIIHDDQRGMYSPASIRKSGNTSSPDAAELALEIEGESELLRCQAVLVPLPTRVMLDEQGVRVQSNVWINWARGQGLLEDRKVVTRNILVRSNTLKQTLRNAGKGQTGADTQDFWSGLPEACQCRGMFGWWRYPTGTIGTRPTRTLRQWLQTWSWTVPLRKDFAPTTCCSTSRAWRWGARKQTARRSAPGSLTRTTTLTHRFPIFPGREVKDRPHGRNITSRSLQTHP